MRHGQPRKPGPSGRVRARWALASVCVALTLLAIIFAATEKFSSATSFSPTPYFEAKKAGIDVRLEHAKSYFEMTLLTLGALWALLIAQKDETRIRLDDRPEIIMLVTASIVLVLSVLWHNFYLDAVSAAYSRATDTSLVGGPASLKGIKMPDVFQPAIDTLREYQARFFVCGLILAVCTLVSAHHLKEDTP